MVKEINENKILLVEDDEVLTDMYLTKFKSEGMEYLSAPNGEEGLILARKEKPVLILLDIMMPKLDGFSVLAELKKDPKTKDIPVIILSNLGQDSDISKGRQLGAIDYVVKASMTPSQIVDKAKQYLK
jgi:DNA-binding response OmpR family regulator